MKIGIFILKVKKYHNEILVAVGSLPSVNALDSCINDAYVMPWKEKITVINMLRNTRIIHMLFPATSLT